MDGGDISSPATGCVWPIPRTAGLSLVFGVDDHGRVFPYYQEQRLTGVAVAAGARVFLPGSVELDSHSGWERDFCRLVGRTTYR